MELLERERALAALAAARESAACGEGRVVFVTGEPGIGKTSLVTQFVRDLEPGARVLLGTCDDLSIPRPLGPLRDLCEAVSAPLEHALSVGAPAHEIQGLLIDELELAPVPTVLVLEDVHWADDATIDSITLLGRRIGSLPAVLVLTYRGGEVPPGHPLRAAMGAIPAAASVFVELAPLSEGAVASLAGREADDVFVATGGNPFYVTELLACRDAGTLPPSVTNAVLGRTARLADDERSLAELVSVVPRRVPASMLDTLMPGWPAAAEEPERRQLLEVGHGHVRFRHELARHAVRSSVPSSTRRRLHAEILSALLAANADPSDIVHHAEAAGDRDVVARYALVAARHAAAVGANREAYAHYRRASDFVTRMAVTEQAAVLEELANAAYVVGRIDEALAAVGRAITVDRDLGDDEAVGRCTRALSRYHWMAGQGARAREAAFEAVAILEPLGESVELARAYSGISQLAMLAHDSEQAELWGVRALDLATRLGDQSTRAHALVNLGTVRAQFNAGETAMLLEAHAIAHAAGEREDASRALGNLAYTLLYWVKPEQSTRYAKRALDYAREYEVHTIASYMATTLAWLRLRAGDWEEAEAATLAEIEQGITVPEIVGKTVLAELAVRRGDPDANERLAELAALAERTGDLQRLTPVLELTIESALTGGDRMPIERVQHLLADSRLQGTLTGWACARVGAWAAVAGIETESSTPGSAPLSAMAARDWLGAADAFGEVDWTYDRALMLSLLDDEESLVEAIEIARGLGAEPLTRRVAGRLRELGLSVPVGPRRSTRANPAGLTARQLDVLSLLTEGLTNVEIADRLVVSPRTAEHHVSAVLTKLGAATRRDAARRASELGFVEHGGPSARNRAAGQAAP